MAHAVHVYRPHRSDVEILEKISVAREPMLEEILERLAAWEPKRSRQHYVLIGPRGIGKTHFLRLIENRLEKRPELRAKWVSVVLPEDFYGVSRISDLLLEMLRSLAQRHTEGDLARVYAETRRDPDDQRVNDRCLDALRAYHRETGRGVVLMVENLDRLLQRQFRDRKEAHLLRKILIEEPWLVLLASSPTYLAEIANPDQPFFEFFKVQILAELSPEEQREMLERLAAIEDNLEFQDYLREMGPRLRALYHFTGGNPRLSVMLYDLVSKREVSAVRNELDLLLDQMTPFYQDRMRDVSEQEAKILETISILPEGCTPSELAEEVRLPAKTVRAVLSRLEKAGYLRRSERRKKQTFYTVPERFFRIWHQMNHSRAARGRVQYLLEFFASWYATREERDEAWEQLKGEFASGLDSEDGRATDLAEYMGYLVEVSKESERFARHFDRLEQLYVSHGWDAVHQELDGSDREHEQEREYWLHRGLFMARALENHREASVSFRRALELGGNVMDRFNYGVALAKGGDPGAKKIFDAAIQSLTPESEKPEDLRPIDVLTDILRSSENRQLTKMAAYLMAHLGQPDALEVLRDVLSGHSADWRRVLCTNALGMSGHQDQASLLHNLVEDRSHQVRAAAATALGRLNDAEAVEPLIRALEDEASEVRGSAATALGRLRDPRTVEPLIHALEDEANDVRGSAATALARLGDLKAVEPLIRTLEDDDPINRGSAATALGQLGDPKAVKPLIRALEDEANDVRGSAATALARLGDLKAVEPLIRTLEDDDPINRGSAATALGRLRDPKAVGPLIRALQDEDPKNRGSAATALGRLRDPKAVEPLIRALEDEASDVRGSATAALGRLGDAESVEPLIQKLEDPASAVRVSAATALGSLARDLAQKGEVHLTSSIIERIPVAELSQLVSDLLRSAFLRNDLLNARRLIQALSESAGYADWLWEPFEIALKYLTEGNPSILESQHAEMREAVHLVLDLVPEHANPNTR